MPTDLTPATGPFYSSMVSHDWQALGFPALKAAQFWDTRSCGVACLRMVYGRLKPGLQALPATITEELLRDGAYSEQSGWSHEGLALHGRKYGLKAERTQLLTQETFMDAVREPGALIVSVGHSFETEGQIRTPCSSSRDYRAWPPMDPPAVKSSPDARKSHKPGPRHILGPLFRPRASGFQSPEHSLW